MPSCGTTVQQRGVRRRRFLYLGTNLISPVGETLRFCGTFSGICVFPEKYSYPVCGSRASCFLITMWKPLRQHSPNGTRLGFWRYTLLSSRRRRSLFEEKSKSLGAGNPVSGSFQQCWRSLGFISTSLTQRKCICHLILLDWQRIFCYENRTDAYGALPGGCGRRCPSGSTPIELRCNHAPSSVPKSGIQVEEHVHCASETGDRMSPLETSGYAT